jgi:tetratricopeptide (TPR) repeat protein
MSRVYRAVAVVSILFLLTGCAKNPQEHFDKGDMYFDQEMYSEAMAEYIKAIEIKPDWALPHNNLGRVYEETNKPDLAIREYSEAIRLDPKLAEAHYNLASVYYDRRSFSQAIDSYKKALQIDPNMADAHYNLGAAYYETRQFELARREALEAQRLGFDATFLLEAIEAADQ